MGNEITKYTAESGAEITLSPMIVKSYLVNGDGKITDKEITLFLELCKYQRLNPFLREAYLIKFGEKPATMVTGKEVFTKRAMRNPNFDGMEAGITVINKNDDIVERKGAIVAPNEQLIGGWARVYRKDYRVPIETSASMSPEEYSEYIDEYLSELEKQRKRVLNSYSKSPAILGEKLKEAKKEASSNVKEKYERKFRKKFERTS